MRKPLDVRSSAPEGSAAPAVLHRIVVVGGGAAGLELVTRLGDTLARRGRARVALVDCSRTHIWKPLLHEVAAGSMDIGAHAVDYLAQAHQHHFQYRIGEMIGLDRANRRVHLGASFDSEGKEVTPPRSLEYDSLVIAIGGRSNDFGTPGVKEHAISLDAAEEAVRFHQRLVNGLIRAHAQPGPVRPGQLDLAVIGAGATGTELAAELHRTARQIVAYGLDRIDPEKDLKITLIEAGERILPGTSGAAFGRRHAASRPARHRRPNARRGLRKFRPIGVKLADGQFVPSELVVWAAGVKGPDVLRDLDGLESNRNQQLAVLPTLQTTLDPNVFAIGDCAFLMRHDEPTAIPPRAQAAHQQASHLARQLKRHLEQKPLEPFRYRDFGSLVSLGAYSTVGSLMGFLRGKSFLIEGTFARLMYQSLYKMHQQALHGTAKVALDTIARTLTRRTDPRVKLH